MRTIRPLTSALLGLFRDSPPCQQAAAHAAFTMAQVLHYPYATELAAAERGDAIAWVRDLDGVRNVWFAHGPDFAATAAHPLHRGRRAGNHAAHLLSGRQTPGLRARRRSRRELAGGRQPRARSADSSPSSRCRRSGPCRDRRRAGKDRRRRHPAISSRGQLAYTKDDQVWTARSTARASPSSCSSIAARTAICSWSPDGSRLAFVSNRGDHAFIGVFTAQGQAARLPRALDGQGSLAALVAGRRAYRLRPAAGRRRPAGAVLKQTPHPWSIWVANVGDGGRPPRVAEPQHAVGLLSRRRRRGQSALGCRRPAGVSGLSRRLAASLFGCRRRWRPLRCSRPARSWSSTSRRAATAAS